jgi:hypothetical protein
MTPGGGCWVLINENRQSQNQEQVTRNQNQFIDYLNFVIKE